MWIYSIHTQTPSCDMLLLGEDFFFRGHHVVTGGHRFTFRHLYSCRSLHSASVNGARLGIRSVIAVDVGIGSVLMQIPFLLKNNDINEISVSKYCILYNMWDMYVNDILYCAVLFSANNFGGLLGGHDCWIEVCTSQIATYIQRDKII